MSITLDPYILKQTQKYIKKGYYLPRILSEYDSELDLDLEFIQEICVAYYHLNQGPDLRDYQQETLDKCLTYYQESENNINYQLRWCCGLGKTKMASTIIKRGNFKSICIGLPSVLLLEQFYDEIKLYFPGLKIYRVYGGNQDGDLKNKISPVDGLHKYLTSGSRYKIVLTTYHSSYKIKDSGFDFDICVADEAHHLEKKNQSLFGTFNEIKSHKKLFLTATPNINPENKSYYSFSNSPVFQGESDTRSVSWSIKNNYISDYRLVILNMRQVDFTDLQKLIREYKNKDLVLAAYMAVKAIYQGISQKILIYSNTLKNSKTIKQIIDSLLVDFARIFTDSTQETKIGNYELYGEHTKKERDIAIKSFKQEKVGIMCSVQLFGEGFDYPGLDTVLFAEKMTSDIRIVQSGLRPCRKDPNNPDKIAHILIPIQEDDFSKVKQVLCKMKEIDNVRDKLAIVGKNQLTKSEIEKFIRTKGRKVPDNIKRVLAKVELIFIDDTIKENFHDVTHSKIIECVFNGKQLHDKNLRYKSILLIILKHMGRTDVIKHLSFNTKYEDMKRQKGYVWNPDLQLSIQGYDSNHTYREILRLVKVFKYTLNIKIKLKNKEIIMNRI